MMCVGLCGACLLMRRKAMQRAIRYDISLPISAKAFVRVLVGTLESGVHILGLHYEKSERKLSQ